MFEKAIRLFLVWAYRHAGYVHRRRVVTFDGEYSFRRIEFLWPDEWIRKGQVWNRPPWWRPFNAFLHCWRPKHDGEEFHDHPRWSITVCLRGQMVERTPWAERILRPGSIVIRSRKAIHGFYVPLQFRGKTWTLFIVGRRNHRQNRYAIKAQSLNSHYRKQDDL